MKRSGMFRERNEWPSTAGGLPAEERSGYMELYAVAARRPLSVGVLTVFHFVNDDESFLLIDGVENTELAHSVPPEFLEITLELFDVRPVVRVLPELRIDVLGELLGQSFVLCGAKRCLGQFGLRDPIVSRQL